jgi:hypothetical protein
MLLHRPAYGGRNVFIITTVSEHGSVRRPAIEHCHCGAPAPRSAAFPSGWRLRRRSALRRERGPRWSRWRVRPGQFLEKPALGRSTGLGGADDAIAGQVISITGSSQESAPAEWV